jgi:L-lactate dehydrogenase complex protein LldG
VVGRAGRDVVVSAREEMLGRIRSALAGQAPPPEPRRDYRRQGEHPPGSPALLELLTDRLVDYRATVLACAAGDVPSVVAAALDARDLRRVVAPAGVPAGWLGDAEVLRDDPPLPVEALDAAHGVVTGSAVAIAETGTIVLDAGADQGRRALTLVPDVHVVVVRAEQVVQTVPEALTRLDPLRPLTMISGPSATSDIELDRVEGVHGPRTLIVVLAG